jgi:cell division protein FtsB
MDPIDNISLNEIENLERIQQGPPSVRAQRQANRRERIIPFIEQTRMPQPLLFAQEHDELGNEPYVEREITFDEEIMNIITNLFYYSEMAPAYFKKIYIEIRTHLNDEQKRKILREFKILLASYINFSKEYLGQGNRFNEMLDKLNKAKNDTYWALKDPSNEVEHEYRYIDDEYNHNYPMEEGGKKRRRMKRNRKTKQRNFKKLIKRRTQKYK